MCFLMVTCGRHKPVIFFLSFFLSLISFLSKMCHGDKTPGKQRYTGHWALCFGYGQTKNKTLGNNRIGGCMDDSQSWGNPCHSLRPKS